MENGKRKFQPDQAIGTDAIPEKCVQPEVVEEKVEPNKVAPPIPALTEPYEITIKTSRGSLTQVVENLQHVDLVMNCLMVLNRPKPIFP